MLDPKQRQRLEERLLAERRRTLDDLRQLGAEIEDSSEPDNDVRMPTHLADRASDVQESDMDVALAERLGDRLQAIDDALVQIRERPDEYGRSTVSGKPIPYERLDLVPWARTLADEETEDRDSDELP